MPAMVENTIDIGVPFAKYTPVGGGFFFEYSRGLQRSSADGVKFGPMIQKETEGFGPITVERM